MISKLREEHNILNDSFIILGKEKTDAQEAKKEATDRAVITETQLSSLQTELDRVKDNPSEEVREKVIDKYIQSIEFQKSSAQTVPLSGVPASTAA